jgi:hypothetical protein
VVAAGAAGQSGVDLKPYKIEAKPVFGDALSKMYDLQQGKLNVSGPDYKTHQKMFRDVAQSLVNKVTYEQYYTAAETGELKARSADQTPDYLLADLNRHILVPDASARFSSEQKLYIHEFGAALDESIRAVLLKMGPRPPKATVDPPAIIRVNAGRMLASAARSGAPAHARTIIELLTNKFYKAGDKFVETPPELVYYALRAAEGLLAAYDPVAHFSPNPAMHSLKDNDLAALIKVLDGIIVNGPQVADKAAESNPDQLFKPGVVPKDDPDEKKPGETAKLDPKSLNADQEALVKFFRRQAVRALARVRFDMVLDTRPAFTLARVAVSDDSIRPAPSPHEIGDAVIGLVGIHPTHALNVDEWAVDIAAGTTNFVRTWARDNKSVPWRVYGSKLAAAFANLRKTAPVNARLRPYLQPLGNLADIVTADISGPLTPPAGREGEVPPNIERLIGWINSNLPKDPNRSLYNDGQYRLNPRAAR